MPTSARAAGRSYTSLSCDDLPFTPARDLTWISVNEEYAC